MSTEAENGNIRDTFLFANTLQFLFMFSPILNIDPIHHTDLEQILSFPLESTSSEAETKLGRLYKNLVKNLHASKSPSDEFLCQTLAREYRRHGGEDNIPAYLQPEMDGQRKIWMSLSTLTPTQRLETLHDLCTFLLYDIEVLIMKPSWKDGGCEWRIDPLAADRSGNNYWRLADRILYRQTKNDEWKCIAWDLETWKNFIAANPFMESRRTADKQVLKLLNSSIYPSIEPILLSEDRALRARIKKEQAELERIAFTEVRKRSSRLVAKERIRETMRMENSNSSSLNNNDAEWSSPPSSKRRVLSRAERAAMRSAKIEEQHVAQIIEESKREKSEENSDGEDGNEDWDIIEEDVEKSPIKLVMRREAGGQFNAQVFIGEEKVEKTDDMEEEVNQINEEESFPVEVTDTIDEAEKIVFDSANEHQQLNTLDYHENSFLNVDN